MKEETIETYSSQDPWARLLGISEAKVGKTCFLVAAALGVLPWQKNGGIVDAPENLHILTFDSKAAGGLARFLKETCGASDAALKFRIYNMEQDLRAASLTDEYDRTFIAALMETAQKISARLRPNTTPMVLVSSLTGMADGLLTSIRSQVGGDTKGTGMDMSKWGEFALQVSTMRSMFQAMPAHVVWEAHLLKMVRKGQNGEETTESVQIPGQSGVNFPYNVDQVFRLRRSFNQKFEKTNCDKAFMDPKPDFDFISNGRNFNEALKGEPQYDPTLTFHKLGLKIGKWGKQKKAP